MLRSEPMQKVRIIGLQSDKHAVVEEMDRDTFSALKHVKKRLAKQQGS